MLKRFSTASKKYSDQEQHEIPPSGEMSMPPESGNFGERPELSSTPKSTEAGTQLAAKEMSIQPETSEEGSQLEPQPYADFASRAERADISAGKESAAHPSAELNKGIVESLEAGLKAKDARAGGEVIGVEDTVHNAIDSIQVASLAELLEAPQEQFDVPPIVSKGISDALSNKDWALALELAIQEGWRDENKLTDLLFFGQHPELGGRKLDPDKNKEDQKLSQEWEQILNREVWSAIVKSAANSALAVSGEDVTTSLHQFRGKDGKEFKALVEWAAKEVDLNPGLLAANLLAETGTRWDYLTQSEVSSYRIGVDDFYDRRGALSSNVPAYSRVGWDRKQKPEVHLNDAQASPREVKTIRFNHGRDALLASAVYLKYGEVYLRNEAKKLGGNFDSLPIDTRFALVRMAFAAGPAGARTRLVRALKGEDILDRVNKPLKIYQTDRNATIRVAQALHLSDWIFGVPPASS